METQDLIATAKQSINAPVEKVWNALIDPVAIKKYMFGTTVTSDWKEGSKITWKGEWQGNAYEDKGTILELKPNTRLKYSHFSPLSGLADTPENYHTVTIDLTKRNNQTIVSLSQDNNENEQTRMHSEKNWHMMLRDMKNLLEHG
jgi:uncharacterized protein YndB with AHSA1/START domain